jgi:ribosomal-protein-alanine N-acetyltransferase
METRDLPDVLAIENISFPNPWHETTFRGEIQNNDLSYPLVVIHRNLDKVIGYIVYWKIREEVQINNIAVHPDFKSMGIGEAILGDVIQEARGEGVHYISLEVRPSNTAARGLYAKLGFELIGIRRNYYSNPDEDAIVLGMSLS